MGRGPFTVTHKVAFHRRPRIVFPGALRTPSDLHAQIPRPASTDLVGALTRAREGMPKRTVISKEKRTTPSERKSRLSPSPAAPRTATKDRERGPMQRESRSACPSLASSFSLNGRRRGPDAKTPGSYFPGASAATVPARP